MIHKANGKKIIRKHYEENKIHECNEGERGFFALGGPEDFSKEELIERGLCSPLSYSR